MPTYVITGVSKGLGYGFLKVISEDTNNTVIGLVRNKSATDEKISGDPDLKGRSNIRILKADVTDYDSLKTAVAETAKITDSVDYLIANAGLVPQFDAYNAIGVLGQQQPKEVGQVLHELIDVNVLGNIHLFNLFLPLVLKSQTKKVVTISTGLADDNLINEFEIELGSLYSASKAAMNHIVSRFSAQYKKDGVLFLSISPGLVDVGHYDSATPDQLAAFGGMAAKFAKYAPHFKGPITPEESARLTKSVWEKATADKDGGAFLSHLGTKQWL